jgi:hypothetical protein
MKTDGDCFVELKGLVRKVLSLEENFKNTFFEDAGSRY